MRYLFDVGYHGRRFHGSDQTNFSISGIQFILVLWTRFIHALFRVEIRFRRNSFIGMVLFAIVCRRRRSLGDRKVSLGVGGGLIRRRERKGQGGWACSPQS